MKHTAESYDEFERFRYLADLPQDMRDIVHDTVDGLDYLLNLESTVHYYTHDYRENKIHRTFQYVSDVPTYMNGGIIIDLIKLRYSKLKHDGESYAMQIEWGSDTTPAQDMFGTTYSIEMYQNGPAHAHIEQNGLWTMRDGILDMPERRRMERDDFTSLSIDLGRLTTALAIAESVVIK